MSDWDVEASAEDGVVIPLELAEIEAASRWVLDREKPRDGEISIALVTDSTIANLNEEYLSHSGPTDVISFPLEDPRRLLGDIYIGVEQARRQAEDAGVSLREELLRLAIHGTLHVIGWDHPEGEASPMFLRQEELLADFLQDS